MKRLYLAYAMFLFTHIGFASQTIQIHVQLPAESPTAALLFVLYDRDQGKKTPYFMPLPPGQSLQTLQVTGDHYQIIQWTIQAPNLTFTPCTPTQLISSHSLLVTMRGAIENKSLHCTLREVAAIPQTELPRPIVIPTGTAEKPVTSQTGDQGIAAYLTALSQGCQKGQFQAKVNTQSVTYRILGMQAGKCAVSITADSLPPLLCQLNNNDIALLASPAEIENYKLGISQHSENSLSSRIMQARCKSA